MGLAKPLMGVWWMSKIKNIGYYGTTQAKADKILREQRFINSTKNNEWLGNGVYFFAYQNDAEWWVKADRFKNQKTAIIKADLEYTDKQLLDLDDREQLEKMYKILREAFKIRGNGADFNVYITDKPLYQQFCWACNMIKKILPSIGIIIYTFSQNKNYKYIPFTANQRQICVSDHTIIKYISRVAG